MKDQQQILNDKIQEWLDWDKNETTREEIETLVQQQNFQLLHKLLCNRMTFGTAGLRAQMGAGFSRMNELTIIQTAQGFSKYMLEATPDAKQKGVIIGYDARHNSKRFAELTTCVLLQQGIPVFLFSQICPTPFVAYGVLRKGCSWGVMVTASHNPKQDNGFKVYYSNGAQIISPHDKAISKCIMENLEPKITSRQSDILKRSMILQDPYADVFQSYYECLLKLSFDRCLNTHTSITFTYTAMHGVGYPFFTHALTLFGFKACVPVLEQVEPDPEFPTVEYPNPEEGKSALNLAISTANHKNSTIILANDPDADRLAVAVKKPDGDWHTLTGNELGSLIGWWLIKKYKEGKNGDGSNGHCLASTVSSKILKAMCSVEGLGYQETLTGFKYMGNEACDLMAKGRDVVFAFEEAIGYMCGSTVIDKDGISASVVVAELAAWSEQQQLTLLTLLLQIHHTYGYHTSLDSYYICSDKDKIHNIFQRIRQLGGAGYPEHIGSYKVKYIRDLSTGYDNHQADNKAILPVSASSEMITFTFEAPPVVMTLRTSGTEPKIKYYSEYCADPKSKLSREEMREGLQELVKSVVEELLQPQVNQLQVKH